MTSKLTKGKLILLLSVPPYTIGRVILLLVGEFPIVDGWVHLLAWIVGLLVMLTGGTVNLLLNAVIEDFNKEFEKNAPKN